MFTNCNACTIYHKEVGANRMYIWERHVIYNIYWDETNGQTQGGKDLKRSDSIYVAIPESSLSDYIPVKDDIICKGIISGKGMSEIEEPIGHKIMTVIDCRYGSKAVRHIEVTAQ